VRLRLLVLGVLAASTLGAYPASAARDCKGLPAHSALPVVDAANVIPPQAEAYLNADVVRFRVEGHESIVAVVVPTLGGDDVASYAKRMFDCWGIGNADSDNGILVLVAMREHRSRIELGAGLEGDVSAEDLDQALSAMVAPLRAGDVGGGLRAAAEALAADLGATLPDTATFVSGGGAGGGDATDAVGSGGAPFAVPSQYAYPNSSPFRGTDSGTGFAVLVPIIIVLGVLMTLVRALRGGFGGGGASTWRGGFPGYGGTGWGSPSLLHRGGWSGWGSDDSGSSWSSGSSFSSGSSSGGGSSGGGSSFGGGSSGGGGASGSW
jgi:uncharacterized protein